MEYNKLINELVDLLDNLEDIKKIKLLKIELMNDKKLLKDIENYHLNSNVDNKKIIFSNQKYVDYLKAETNINFLVKDIKIKFNSFNIRKCFK